MTPTEHLATRPDSADYAPYIGTYISDVPEGDGRSAWELTGTADGFNYSVRAIAFVIAGHLEHHLKVIRTRYIPNLPA